MELKNDNANTVNDGAGDDSLMAYMRIGNSMRTKITFLEDDTAETTADPSSSSAAISVSSLMSTMMMPPEPVFKLETFLSNSLPKMTRVEKKLQTTEAGEERTILTFTGLGKIVCQEAEV